MQTQPALELKDLAISFRTGKGTVHAVRGISLAVNKGETLAIVGESGSGKSVSAKAILGIEAPNAVIEGGKVLYGGRDLLCLSEKEFGHIRGSRITMIFQDPLSSLDPIVRIGPQLTEATVLNARAARRSAAKELRATLALLEKTVGSSDAQALSRIVRRAQKRYAAHFAALPDGEEASCDLHAASLGAPDFLLQEAEAEKPGWLSAFPIPEAIPRIKELVMQKTFRMTRRRAYTKAVSIMREVGISEPEKRFNQYPFEFSGGMRQRIVIAIAIAANPDLLICDEPTTALDVTIQAQILELINRLKKTRGMSVIFITHDLGVVANVADRIAVMYAGKIVEEGTAEDIFWRPAHPYTWALLASMPDLDTTDELEAIPGTPPNMLSPPQGDAFAPRNRYAMKIDFEAEPPLFRISETHSAATWLLHPSAPAVEMPRAVSERIARMRARAAAR